MNKFTFIPIAIRKLVAYLVGVFLGAPILFSFPLPVCYARPIYIYNVFIRVTATMNLYYKFILRETKMADFERRQLELRRT